MRGLVVRPARDHEIFGGAGGLFVEKSRPSVCRELIRGGHYGQRSCEPH